MEQYLNNIINNPNSTQKEIFIAKEWLELDKTTGGRSTFDATIPQILPTGWEQLILSQ